ncbi:hypothetical protein HAX54_003541, partial [Datura stramonium]|nr:hypothetical protein [Datura stramonium]
MSVDEFSEDFGEGMERYYRGKVRGDKLRRRWGSNGELMCWGEVERWERGKYREVERLDVRKTKKNRAAQESIWGQFTTSQLAIDQQFANWIGDPPVSCRLGPQCF